MAHKSAYLVFLLPVIVSVPTASAIFVSMAEIDLDILKASPPAPIGSDTDSYVEFIGLLPSYALSDTLTVKAKIHNEYFDCGDVYITFYDSIGNSILQKSYFDQCFSTNNSTVPVDNDDEFSILLDTAGEYTVTLDILDTRQKITSSESVQIVVGQ